MRSIQIFFVVFLACLSVVTSSSAAAAELLLLGNSGTLKGSPPRFELNARDAPALTVVSGPAIGFGVPREVSLTVGSASKGPFAIWLGFDGEDWASRSGVRIEIHKTSLRVSIRRVGEEIKLPPTYLSASDGRDFRIAARVWDRRHLEIVKDGRVEAVFYLDPKLLKSFAGTPDGRIAIESAGRLLGSGLKTDRLDVRQRSSFQVVQSIPVTAGPYFVTAADLDGDGMHDLLAANRGPLFRYSANNTISWMRGVEDGQFMDPIHFEIGTGPYTVEVADVDEDGVDDILAAAFFDWRGQGLAALSGKDVLRAATEAARPEGSLRLSSGKGAAAFRLRNIDIAAGESFRLAFRLQRIVNGPLEVWLGFKGSNMSDRKGLLIQLEPEALDIWAREASDWDNFRVRFDGRFGTGDEIEFLVSDGSVITLKINGKARASFDLKGRFQQSGGILPAGSVGFQIANPSVEAVLDDVLISTVENPKVIFRGDFNSGDVSGWTSLTGEGEISAIPTGRRLTQGLSFIRAPGLKPIKSKDAKWPIPGTTSLAARDFDGDGHIDLATVSWTSDALCVYRGDGQGAFRLLEHHQSSEIGLGLRDIKAADLDRDGVLDLAITCYESNHVVIFQGLGNGKFRFERRYGSGGRTPYHLAIADLNGDGWKDLVVGNYSGQVKILTNSGAGLEFATAATLSAFGANWKKQNEIRDVAVADFDGDGIADIAIACASPDSGYLSILGGQSVDGRAVSFKPAVNHYLGFRTRSLIIRDFDADGAVDIAVARHDANDILVLKQIRPGSPRQ